MKASHLPAAFNVPGSRFKVLARFEYGVCREHLCPNPHKPSTEFNVELGTLNMELAELLLKSNVSEFSPAA
jgi:hypothetical protein